MLSFIQDKEIVQDIAYAIKAVNVFSGKGLYNAILPCQSSSVMEVDKKWRDSFSGVCEYIFIARKPLPKKGIHVATQLHEDGHQLRINVHCTKYFFYISHSILA